MFLDAFITIFLQIITSIEYIIHKCLSDALVKGELNEILLYKSI
jgi:hypothetical protein